MRGSSTLRVAALALVAAGVAATSQGAVTGRVVTTEGAALAGIKVQAYEYEDVGPLGERRAAGKQPTPLATATSGPDGTFRLESKAPMSWVQATADGYAPAVAHADESAALQLTLKRAALRRGLVTSGGKPVAGAVVIWSTPNGGELLTTSDAAGGFEAPDPESVPGQLAVFHRDFAPTSSYVGAGQRTKSLDQQLEAGQALTGRAVDATGRPVADGRVWVDGSWPVARTDAKGSFIVPHAPSDWSSVSVTTPGTIGIAPRKVGSIVVTMKPQRTLSGLVTDAATRLPVAGAMVVVGTPAGTRSAETDARGRYTLGGLPPGRYQPYAGRVGYVSGPAGYASAKPVDLRGATVGRFDAALDREAQVRGRVVDERQQPVDGAQVSLGFKDTPSVYAVDPWSALDMAGAQDPVISGPDGTFTLSLPADDTETAAPFLMGNRPIVVMKRGYAAAQASFERGAAKASPLVVTLPRGLALRGRIQGADGAPIAGVAITAAEDGAMAGSLFPTHMVLPNAKPEGWTVSDEQGRFELRVNPAVHHIFFRKAGYAPQLARSHDPRGAQALEVTLEPAAAVRGRVSRADGRGVAQAQVSVASPLGAGGGNAVTSADGGFEVPDLAPGDYQLHVSHEALSLNLMRHVQAPVSDFQITLAPAVTVRGGVQDAATREPIPRFDVTIHVDSAGESAVRRLEGADAAGAFSVEDVPAGQAKVTVTAEGYAPKTVEGLELEADQEPAPVEMLLEADAPLRGRVSGPSGEGIADAHVNVDRRGTAPDVSVDEDGEYEVRGLPAGEVKLSFAADGFVTEQRTIDSRQTTRVDVTLKRGLTLAGIVVKAGTGVANAFVGAQSSAAGASYQSTQTDAQGRFSLGGLVPGRYTVSANTMGKGSAKLEDVDAETAGPLRLTLDKSGTAVITGRVVGLPDGEVGMAMVMASNDETGETAQATLDASRTFRMAEAPSGRVKVRAIAASLAEGTTRTSRTVELTLAPGSETETVVEFANDITVTGVVVREGAPLPYAMVSFGSENGGVMARTDARGAYQAIGLEPGRHQVNVSGDHVSYATDYMVTASAEFDIDVTGGTLAGRVVQSEGGAPIEGVVVSYFRQGEGENTPDGSATTGAQGAFLQRSLRDGRYRLVTSKAGFGQQVRDVEITSGATTEALIELTAAEGVSVTVVDGRTSRPLEAIVVVRDQSRRIVANRHSGADADGTLNIPLADGSYLLSTSATGYGTVTIPVTSPAQGLRMALTPGGTLVIESARELRGRVRLIQPDGEEYVRCWCNGIAEIQLKGRRTSVENITPGRYTIEIVDAPEGAAPRPVVVIEGQTSTVTIE